MKAKELHLNFYRALIFGPATWYLFFKGHYYPKEFFNQWQPISFYQLLSGPIDSELLSLIEWSWFLISLFAFISLFPKLKLKHYFSPLSKIGSILGIIYLGHDYNFGRVYHGTHLYLGVCLLLAFAPKNKADQPEFHNDLWHIELIKIFIVFLLACAGLQKLAAGGMSWFTTDALFIKLATLPSHTWMASALLKAPLWIFKILAFIIVIGVQVSAPLALWGKKTGLAYLFLWCLFHLGATHIYSVGSSFYSQIFCYFIFFPTTYLLQRKPAKIL